MGGRGKGVHGITDSYGGRLLRAYVVHGRARWLDHTCEQPAAERLLNGGHEPAMQQMAVGAAPPIL